MEDNHDLHRPHPDADHGSLMSVDLRDLERMLQGTVDRIRSDAEDLVRREVGDLAQRTRDAVPVDTGRLQESIVDQDRSSGDVIRRVVGSVGAPAGYFKFVKSAKRGKVKVGPARHVATVDFRRPAEETRKRLQTKIVRRIVDEVQSGD